MCLKGFCNLSNTVKYTVWNCSATIKNRLVTVFLATTWVDIATSKPWRISSEIWTWLLKTMCEREAKISSSVNDLKCFCSLVQCAKISSVEMYTGYTVYKCANGKLEGVGLMSLCCIFQLSVCVLFTELLVYNSPTTQPRLWTLRI